MEEWGVPFEEEKGKDWRDLNPPEKKGEFPLLLGEKSPRRGKKEGARMEMTSPSKPLRATIRELLKSK